MKHAHFILGIKGPSFILEVEVAVGFTLEEKSFEILNFGIKKLL